MSTDDLVKRAKLVEQNKIMREALERIANEERESYLFPALGSIIIKDEIISIAEGALEKVKETEKE